MTDQDCTDDVRFQIHGDKVLQCSRLLCAEALSWWKRTPRLSFPRHFCRMARLKFERVVRWREVVTVSPGFRYSRWIKYQYSVVKYWGHYLRIYRFLHLLSEVTILWFSIILTFAWFQDRNRRPRFRHRAPVRIRDKNRFGSWSRWLTRWLHNLIFV